MKKIFRTILTVLALATAMVACKEAQPTVDTSLLEAEVTAREQFVAADAYFHGDVYNTGDASYKMTLTLLSEGITFDHQFSEADHSVLFKGFGGTGYAFELELNTEDEINLSAGIYQADTLDINGDYVKDAFTYNPENSYLVVLHNGNSTRQKLGDVKVNIALAGDVYTVTIEGENAIGVPVKGTYKGGIEVRDILLYLEPTTTTEITLNAAEVIYTPDENNGYYSGGKTYHYLTIVGKAGEEGSLTVVAGKDDIEALPSGTYELNQYGWGYDLKKEYRADGSLSASSFLFINGAVYYLIGGVQVEMDAEGTSVVSLQVDAVSGYGSAVTISFEAPAE